jgi:hypothetical protein
MTRRSTRNFRRIIASSNRRRSEAGEPPALTYEGAYINRSGETNGSNKTISLKFSEAVPTGSNYTTGMTIEVTGDNGSSYSTIDLSNTTQAVVNSNYVQYTLTGTVDTFQGWTGTTGHQVKISYDGSQRWNSSTITAGSGNSETLTNASTINLLQGAVAFWDMDEASGTRSDSVGSNDITDDLTDIDSVGSSTTSIPAGLGGRAADFEADNDEALQISDNTDLSFDDASFTLSGWFKFESVVNYMALMTKAQWSGGTPEYSLSLEGANKLRFRVWSTSNASATWGSAAVTGTWYNVAAYHDQGSDVGIVVNNGTAVETSHTAGVNDSTNNFTVGQYSELPAASASGHYDGLSAGNGVWSRVLSSDEIEDLYNDGDGKIYPYLPDTT